MEHLTNNVPCPQGANIVFGGRGKNKINKQNINTVGADGIGSQGVLGEAVTEVKRPHGQGGM